MRAPALNLTTSLRGDFRSRCQERRHSEDTIVVYVALVADLASAQEYHILL